MFDAMLALAVHRPAAWTDRQGLKDGLARGWFYQWPQDQFQSDRRSEAMSPDELLALHARNRKHARMRAASPDLTACWSR